MTDASRPDQAVLVRLVEKFSASTVASVLGHRAKAPALDFVVSLRRSQGLVAPVLAAVDADALAAALTQAGQDAIAAPTSLIEELPEPVLVSKADLAGDGFDLVAGPQNAVARRYSWGELAALCAGAVETKTVKTVTEGGSSSDVAKRAMRLGLTMVTGVPMLGGKTEKKRDIASTDRALTLDMLFVNPTRRLRIVARAFNFGLLGPQMAHTAEANFSILCKEIAAHAPGALRGKGMRGVLAGRLGDAFFESLADLEGEERWLLNLAVLHAAL